jgi:hypothetical protein
MTDTQVTPQPAAQPDTSVPAAGQRQYGAAQQYGPPPVEQLAKPAWHRRRRVRATAICVAAVVALGGAFGAGALVGRSLGPAGGPAGFSQGELPQRGPGGMTPPDGGDGPGQAPGAADDRTTSDGSGA